MWCGRFNVYYGRVLVSKIAYKVLCLSSFEPRSPESSDEESVFIYTKQHDGFYDQMTYDQTILQWNWLNYSATIISSLLLLLLVIVLTYIRSGSMTSALQNKRKVTAQSLQTEAQISESRLILNTTQLVSMYWKHSALKTVEIKISLNYSNQDFIKILQLRNWILASTLVKIWRRLKLTKAYL